MFFRGGLSALHKKEEEDEEEGNGPVSTSVIFSFALVLSFVRLISFEAGQWRLSFVADRLRLAI